MLSRHIAGYIGLGVLVRGIGYTQEGDLVHGKNHLLSNMDTFFKTLDKLHLTVTKRAATGLIDYKEELSKNATNHKLTAHEASKVRELMRTLENTFAAEARGHIAFVVTEKRIDVEKLLSDVSSLLVPGVFDSMPEIAKYDFVEAGKCISFERPTAAAFHLLRATESVLRHFYCSIAKQKRVSGLLWKPMVEHLKKRKKKPPEELLNHLDHIRNSFRNPTQHPEKIYDIQEAQDLFALCIDVVNRMVKLLRQKKV